MADADGGMPRTRKASCISRCTLRRSDMKISGVHGKQVWDGNGGWVSKRWLDTEVIGEATEGEAVVTAGGFVC